MLAVIGILLKILVVVTITMGVVAYLILVERKVAAYAQDRLGPNRAGREFGIPAGLLQPLADAAKMLLKEDVIPRYVDRPLYILAPSIAIIAAMIGFAVVPFGRDAVRFEKARDRALPVLRPPGGVVHHKLSFMAEDDVVHVERSPQRCSAVGGGGLDIDILNVGLIEQFSVGQ